MVVCLSDPATQVPNLGRALGGLHSLGNDLPRNRILHSLNAAHPGHGNEVSRGKFSHGSLHINEVGDWFSRHNKTSDGGARPFGRTPLRGSALVR